ncbi:MAG: zf-HC2 domain-containing protein [Acidobacteria bacterium]|nr:zf-HC2 domain-containing protein [Acidobacteriota bacterium]
MNCVEVAAKLFRMIDGELPPQEVDRIDAHLRVCPVCARELRMLTLPRKIARLFPIVEPSPYFYRRLKAGLESESRGAGFWQTVMGLSRQVVPALAALTLIVLTAFAYLQVAAPQNDFPQAYESMILPVSQPEQFVFAGRGEITDDVVLGMPAETEPGAVSGNGASSAEPK